VLAGVSVTLAGAAPAETTTDPTGFYEFTELRDGLYVVTPSADGYAFDPQRREVLLAGSDVTTADFTSRSSPPTRSRERSPGRSRAA
jgi:hypothetical protein